MLLSAACTRPLKRTRAEEEQVAAVNVWQKRVSWVRPRASDAYEMGRQDLCDGRKAQQP